MNLAFCERLGPLFFKLAFIIELFYGFKKIYYKRIFFLYRMAGVRTIFMSNHVDHFASTYGDKGWGCGFR